MEPSGRNQWQMGEPRKRLGQALIFGISVIARRMRRRLIAASS